MTPQTDPSVERALASSTTEGVLAQITGSITDHYFAPCALFLGASAAQVGWLSALPKLAGGFAHAVSPRAVRAVGDRRRLLVAGALLQGLALAPAAFVALRPGRGAFAALLAAAMLYQLLGGFMYPAWASLTSEYLPAERRASWFGERNRWLALWGLAALALWGLALDAAGPLRSGAAFAALFACAAVSRGLSTRWMLRLAPRPWRAPARPARSWRAKLDGPLGRLILYGACASFATQLCDAMQPVRLLGELRSGYRGFMLVRLAAGLGAFCSAAWWGRRADRGGSTATLRAAGALMAAAPLAWAATARLPLLAGFELLDGAAAAGFSLCAVNHLYDAVPEDQRLRAIGLYTLAVALALFASAGLSGSLAAAGVPLTALFGCAGALRLIVELALGGRLREPRVVAQPSEERRSASAPPATNSSPAADGSRGSAVFNQP